MELKTPEHIPTKIQTFHLTSYLSTSQNKLSKHASSTTQHKPFRSKPEPYFGYLVTFRLRIRSYKIHFQLRIWE